jgi:hypothetical protein
VSGVMIWRLLSFHPIHDWTIMLHPWPGGSHREAKVCEWHFLHLAAKNTNHKLSLLWSHTQRGQTRFCTIHSKASRSCKGFENCFKAQELSLSCLPLSPPLLYFSIAHSPSWLSFSQIRGRVVYHFIKRRERFKNTCQLHLCLLKEINDHT